MNYRAKIGEIWLVAISVLIVKEEGSFDTGFQIRPFLIVDEGKGMLILENSDYLALKITTKKNNISNAVEIKNWKKLGLKEKSYVRIEIPERIESYQLIRKITALPKEQFLEYYKLMLKIFNVDIFKIIADDSITCG